LFCEQFLVFCFLVCATSELRLRTSWSQLFLRSRQDGPKEGRYEDLIRRANAANLSLE